NPGVFRVSRVAVVGAGAAGLCVARHILSRLNHFAPPVVFELTGNVGGTWCYDERVGTNDNGRPIHSSMYRDLRTNLPKEVMMFPDFPFDPQLSSFLPHQEVQRYLEGYCQQHHIRPHIRFSTVVEDVKPVVVTAEGEQERTVWDVTSSDSSGCRKTETFDSVFVCSGLFAVLSSPVGDVLSLHTGKVLHSHEYRYAEPFSGQSVVVLGAHASGLDISIELARVGAQVTLSHGLPRLTFPLRSGIQQSSPVEAVDEDGSIRFQDGSVTSADVLLFCTGYNFRYPFLDGAQLGLDVQDHLVSPLYRFLMPPAFPSLFFIGICKIICPFPHFHCQVQFALAVLDGSVTLPSAAQMEDEVRREQREKMEQGVQQRHLLILNQDQWEYCHREISEDDKIKAAEPQADNLIMHRLTELLA
uniref:Flavin-containing monooxygenase n=1 Tax=Mola mola TaxID=94237 RepID=A0A3Q3WGM7_MOLML